MSFEPTAGAAACAMKRSMERTGRCPIDGHPQ
jgi:hypothetical protein